MKKIVTLALMILAITTSANAQSTGLIHQSFCQTAEVQQATGAQGSCQIVITQKQKETQGSCTGVLFGSVTCVVNYISLKNGSGFNLTCGSDLSKPNINQSFMAKAIFYNVSALVNRPKLQPTIIVEPKEYAVFDGELLDLTYSEETVDGQIKKEAEIKLALKNGITTLKNVTCN